MRLPLFSFASQGPWSPGSADWEDAEDRQDQNDPTVTLGEEAEDGQIEEITTLCRSEEDAIPFFPAKKG